jgi:uncharacterized membrane protein (UPF0127 family)
MRIIHDPDGQARTIATEIDHAETFLEQTKGLMFRRSLPEDYALVFSFDSAGWRIIHMLFVFVSLDVLWLVNGEVQATETFSPWRSIGFAKADTVIELPSGATDGVSEGDTVRIET